MLARLTILAAFVLAVPLVNLGCGSKTPERTTVEFTDDLGRTVAVPTPVQRIVTMAPNLTEITFAAGAGDRLVGVSTADDYPPEISGLPKFSAVGVDFEAIAALKPDLILATDQVNSPRDADMFASLGLPVFYKSFSTLDDVFGAIHRVGEIAGTGARAADHAAVLRDAIASLRETTASATEKPRVLFLISVEPLFGFGKDSYVHTMIDAAGGESVSRQMEVEAPVFSEEYVIEQAPDVILGSFASETSAGDILDAHPAWTTVPAVRNGRVYAVDPDVVLRPGPRVVEGAYRMALLLHPELFAGDESIVQK